MTRFARTRRVFFFEEPIVDEAADRPTLTVSIDRGVRVCVPGLPPGLSPAEQTAALQALLSNLLTNHRITLPVLWYYTPMALAFSRDVPATAIVFDCMDELSAFKGAPEDLLDLETELLERADLVFTGGQSLYQAKRKRHSRVFPFPAASTCHTLPRRGRS